MKIPAIFDLPDFYPTSAAGYLCDVKSVKGSLLVGSFDFMLRRILRRSYAVTAPSYSLVNYAKKIGAQNVYNIPNGISDVFLNVHDGGIIRKKLGFSDDDFVVGYIGSVEFWLDLKSAIKGLSLAKKNGLPVKLLLVGKGLFTDYSKSIMDCIKQEDLEKDTVWLDFIPYEEVPKYISGIDVGLIPFNVFNPTAFYAAPNKMWEYLSQRKPVISSPIPETLANLDSVLLAITAEDYAKVFSQVRQQISSVQETVDIGYGKALKNTWDYSSELFANLVSSCTKKELIIN
jgi:glycosyltransferase involved in cell wall biosynthesis